MAKLRLLPDVPWGEGIKGPGIEPEKDGLQFEHYAEILARAVLDTPEPFTVGVYGGWGSGKTSLMRMMHSVVDKENNAVPVWFNAWRYEKEEHLIVPLLATIITAMKENRSKWKSMKAAGDNLINAFRSVLYGISVKGKIGIPTAIETEISLSPKEMVERYQDITTDTLLEKSLYFRAFDKFDKLVREKECPKIVIFVDDLDRCFPDKAVVLLEGIKLVLNQKNIAFVLGIAPDIIQSFLKSKFEKEFNIPADLYEDYLDKLVQLPFNLPEIDETVEDYVRSLFKRKDVFDIDEGIFEEQYEPLVKICGPACKNNPRSIIRFLNRLLIMQKVHETKEGIKRKKKPGEPPLAISLVHFGITNALQLKWPEVLRACERDLPIKSPAASKPSPLCENLLYLFFKTPNELTDQLLIPKLQLWVGEEGNPEKDLFRVLVQDGALRSLFGSKPFKEWLEEPELRSAAKAVSDEVQSDRKDVKKKYEPTWAENWDKDGWPITGNYVIKPSANLEGAKLSGAKLSGADLSRAKLSGADLSDTDFSDVNLSDVNLSNATYNSKTIWPTNFKIPSDVIEKTD